MTDAFMDRVAERAGHTVRFLKQFQERLYALGMTAEAAALSGVIMENEDTVFDTQESTNVGGKGRTER